MTYACQLGSGVNEHRTKGDNGPGKEVTEVDELAVPLVFDVNDTPTSLATTHSLTVDDYIAL